MVADEEKGAGTYIIINKAVDFLAWDDSSFKGSSSKGNAKQILTALPGNTSNSLHVWSWDSMEEWSLELMQWISSKANGLSEDVEFKQQ